MRICSRSVKRFFWAWVSFGHPGPGRGVPPSCGGRSCRRLPQRRPDGSAFEQALTAENTESDGTRRIRMSAPSELDMSLYGKVAQGSNEPMTKQIALYSL